MCWSNDQSRRVWGAMSAIIDFHKFQIDFEPLANERAGSLNERSLLDCRTHVLQKSCRLPIRYNLYRTSGWKKSKNQAIYSAERDVPKARATFAKWGFLDEMSHWPWMHLNFGQSFGEAVRNGVALPQKIKWGDEKAMGIVGIQRKRWYNKLLATNEPAFAIPL